MKKYWKNDEEQRVKVGKDTARLKGWERGRKETNKVQNEKLAAESVKKR